MIRASISDGGGQGIGHCLNCGEPLESGSEELALCARCRQIPNLLFG